MNEPRWSVMRWFRCPEHGLEGRFWGRGRRKAIQCGDCGKWIMWVRFPDQEVLDFEEQIAALALAGESV